MKETTTMMSLLDLEPAAPTATVQSAPASTADRAAARRARKRAAINALLVAGFEPGWHRGIPDDAYACSVRVSGEW